MKKQLFRYLSGIIPAIALFFPATAQVAKADLELNLNGFIFNEAKANLASIDGASATNVNARALKGFSKNFKSATNATWFALKDGYVAKFNESGVETKAFYDTKGRWSATVLTYNEDKMSKDIRTLVKSTYFDYNILVVNEVTIGDHTAYLVKIQDASTIKTIRVRDGEMDIYENYKRG